MLYLLACFMGIAAGLAAKGSISNLANFKLEKIYLIIAAFVIRTTAQVLSARGMVWLIESSLLIYGITFLLLLAAFWYNRHSIGALIIGAGCLMNNVVMLLNGGKMPVSLEAMDRAGMTGMLEFMKNGADGKHSLLTESTKLPWLADIIHLPSFLGLLMEIVSIGDLVIALGLAVLTFEAVRGKRINWRDSHAEIT